MGIVPKKERKNEDRESGSNVNPPFPKLRSDMGGIQRSSTAEGFSKSFQCVEETHLEKGGSKKE